MRSRPTHPARLAVNGRYLAANDLGITRYAREVMRELDCIVDAGELVVVVPIHADDPGYQNIPVLRYGKHKGIAWEQIDFARWLKKENAEAVNLCNTLPVFSRSALTVIHDVSYEVNPQFFTGPRNNLSARWHRLCYRAAINNSCHLATVSEFSRRELSRVFSVEEDDITVIGNAWQHMARIKPDSTCLRRLGLESKRYVFTMSSLAPNKNMNWVLETAALNPNDLFVVAGGSRVQENVSRRGLANIVLAGYVTDEEAKSLMQNAKAFLFPSLYEGFGIPPLEALACGTTPLVSDILVMHEVVGTSAWYIDPRTPCSDIDALMCQPVEPAEKVLNRYSWGISARRLLKVLREVPATQR